MIGTLTETEGSAPVVPPVVWGLSARQLHDAYWRSRGVECVRRGSGLPHRCSAELYLLLEKEQMSLFEMSDLSDRMTWHNALIMRLRLLDERHRVYSERVVTNDQGLVRSIERRYSDTTLPMNWVVITTKRRVAQNWSAAATRRVGWDRVRRSVPWSRVNHWKCDGTTFDERIVGEQQSLLTNLVERWLDPSQVIEGIVSTGGDIWHLEDETPPPDKKLIGPLWLGSGCQSFSRQCVVGPSWQVDRRDNPLGTIVRTIPDVEASKNASLNQENQKSRTLYRISKRLLDLLFSFSVLVCLLPLLLIISLAILLSDGAPVFYGHKRQGRGGRTFRCWKFRTMRKNADSMVQSLQESNVCDGPQVLIKNDPRVTPVGNILRSTQLDELPQFLNVLLGQMSIVGPRPSPNDENQLCPAWRDVRLSVRPGITGLWQLKRTRQPGEDFQEWIRFDIEYVRQASMKTDLSILFATTCSFISGRLRRGNDTKI